MAASEKLQKITPWLLSSSRKVVATDTLSNTASTAIPFIIFCSSSGIPNLLYVFNNSGSSSSRLFTSLFLGAEK